MEARLTLVGGRATKKEIKLKLPARVGRSPKADMAIMHPLVSRRHCEIFERDGELIVRDTGSANGTYIEGRRIDESVLKPGDRLTIGPLTFEAACEQATAPAPPNGQASASSKIAGASGAVEDAAEIGFTEAAAQTVAEPAASADESPIAADGVAPAESAGAVESAEPAAGADEPPAFDESELADLTFDEDLTLADTTTKDEAQAAADGDELSALEAIDFDERDLAAVDVDQTDEPSLPNKAAPDDQSPDTVDTAAADPRTAAQGEDEFDMSWLSDTEPATDEAPGATTKQPAAQNELSLPDASAQAPPVEEFETAPVDQVESLDLPDLEPVEMAEPDEPLSLEPLDLQAPDVVAEAGEISIEPQAEAESDEPLDIALDIDLDIAEEQLPGLEEEIELELPAADHPGDDVPEMAAEMEPKKASQPAVDDIAAAPVDEALAGDLDDAALMSLDEDAMDLADDEIDFTETAAPAEQVADQTADITLKVDDLPEFEPLEIDGDEEIDFLAEIEADDRDPKRSLKDLE